MAYISVGYGNLVNAEKINAISTMGSAPIRRIIKEAKKRQQCIDVTEGSKTSSVIFLIDGYIILSAFTPETLQKRLEKVEKNNE